MELATFTRAASVALVGVGLIATQAFAAVTIDGDGNGFVGKGDVQTPFGLNNNQLQKNANDVSFSYEATADYEVTIEFDTGTRNVQHHTVTQGKSTEVSSSVAYEKRDGKKQVTGFNLGGFGSTTVTGDAIPQVGDGCPNGNNCVVTAVEKVSSNGGLYAHYQGSRALLQ